MEQSQITLEKIYEMLKKIEVEIEAINSQICNNFSEAENDSFIEGTRAGWNDADAGNFTEYSSTDDFLDSFEDAENN